MTSRTTSQPILLLCSLLVVMLLAAPVRAVTVENSEHHFSYSLPRGWSSFTSAEMAKINSGKVNWLHGGRGPSGAYFLVIAGKLPPTPDGPGQIYRYRQELEEPGVTIESINWDARRNAYVSRISVPKGDELIHCMCFAFCGPAERIKFYCYPDGTDIAPVVPDLNVLADSFSFDEAGAAAAPRSGGEEEGGGSGGGGHTTWMVILGVMGGGVCFLVFVIIAGTILFAILRKRKAGAP
jgi:hypothetical protein